MLINSALDVMVVMFRRSLVSTFHNLDFLGGDLTSIGRFWRELVSVLLGELQQGYVHEAWDYLVDGGDGYHGVFMITFSSRNHFCLAMVIEGGREVLGGIK